MVGHVSWIYIYTYLHQPRFDLQEPRFLGPLLRRRLPLPGRTRILRHRRAFRRVVGPVACRPSLYYPLEPSLLVSPD